MPRSRKRRKKTPPRNRQVTRNPKVTVVNSEAADKSPVDIEDRAAPPPGVTHHSLYPTLNHIWLFLTKNPAIAFCLAVLGIILTIIGLSTNFIAPKLLGWLLSGPNASVQVSIYHWPADHPTCWSYLIDIGSAGEFRETVDQIYLKATFPGSLANFTFGGAQETSSDKGTEGLFYRHLKPGEERSLLEVDKDGECHAKPLEFTDAPYFKVVPKGVHQVEIIGNMVPTQHMVMGIFAMSRNGAPFDPQFLRVGGYYTYQKYGYPIQKRIEPMLDHLP